MTLAPRSLAGQLALLLERITARRAELEAKRRDLEASVADLDAVARNCRKRLKQLKNGTK